MVGRDGRATLSGTTGRFDCWPLRDRALDGRHLPRSLRRIAARKLRGRALSVDAVTFLGAPLQRPVVGCSSSLRRLHGRVRRWLSEENAVAMTSEHRTVALPAIASISGGCRDGTVPSYLSDLSGLVPPAAIALSTTTQHMPGVQTVVDHTALLWCNQLVRRVARSIVASAALRMRAESSRPSPSLPLASRVQTLRAALIGPDAHTTSQSSVAGSTTALGSEGHVQHAASRRRAMLRRRNAATSLARSTLRPTVNW